MVAVLAGLGLSRLADIPGLTAVGAAAILAETGDPRRYDSSSSLVKHAGLSPSDNASGAFYGEARISRRGRPGLRLTVWRAVWPLIAHNPVMAAKYQAMTHAADTATQAAAAQADAGSRQVSAAAAAARARRAKARVGSVLQCVHFAEPAGAQHRRPAHGKDRRVCRARWPVAGCCLRPCPHGRWPAAARHGQSARM